MGRGKIEVYIRNSRPVGCVKIKDMEQQHTEEFRVSGDEVMKKVKELLAEGKARRIIIKNEEGKTLVEIPVLVGAVGALLAPTLAALGAIAALVTKCTIVIERKEKTEDESAQEK